MVDGVGRGVGGVTLTWTATSGEAGGSVSTAADGAFSLPAPPGSFGLEARAPDGRQARRSFYAAPFDELRLRLYDVGALEGVVRAPTGSDGVAGATVRAWDWHFGEVETRTRDDGTFRLEGVPKELRFQVRVEAGARGRALLRDVRWGPRGLLEIRLPQVRTLRGRVVREEPGRGPVGVAGVQVQSYLVDAVYYGGISAHPMIAEGDGVLTGEDGSFAYEGLTRSGILYVRSETWELRREDKTYRGGFDWSWNKPVELVVVPRAAPALPKPATPGEPTPFVFGTVIDEDGRPLAGAEVNVRWEVEEKRWTRCRSRDTTTAPDGTYRVDGLPADIACCVDADAPGFDDERVEHVFARLEGRHLPPIRLARLVRRRGRVVDPDGRPLPTATCRDEAVDEEGRFELAVPLATNYSFRVEAPGFLCRYVERKDFSETEDLVVVLEPASVIEGQVLDVRGRPVCPARVGAMGPRYVHSWDGASTDPDGRFRLELPVDGTWRLEAEAEGHLFAPLAGVETGRDDVVLEAVHPTFVEGRLVDPDARGIGKVIVRAEPEGGGRERWDFTDEEGRFRIEELAGHTFRLSVSRTDEDLRARGLVVRRLEGVLPFARDVVLQATPTRTIAGTVFWPDGSLAAGVDVHAVPDGHDAWYGEATTDAHGRFSIPGLLPGGYTVCASAWVACDGGGEEDDDEDDDVDDEDYYGSDASAVEAGARDVALRLFVVHDEE